jgi:excisionase family DNA binding protein
MRMLTTRELSDALGISESSLKRWVDAGKIVASRTEGGHRRIRMADAMRFIRDSRTPLVRPDLLDLPEIDVARVRGERFSVLLQDGDAVGARGWLTARYLEGATIADLADGPIREAMHAIGTLWKHDDGGVFVEHRATDICLHAVAQLRSMVPAVAANAPVALGAAPAGDPYLLPTLLVSMVAAEAGFRSINLGPETPVEALAHAIAQHHPKLVWLSISSALEPARARAIARWIGTLRTSITVAVGGQQAETLANLPSQTVRASSMHDIAEIATAIVKR